MAAQLEFIIPETAVSSQPARLRALPDDDEEDSDRAYRRRAVPKTASRPKVKRTKAKASAGADAPEGSETSRSLRLRVIPPARTSSVLPPAAAPIVLGLPEQSSQPEGRKNKTSGQKPKDPTPSRKKRRVGPVSSSSHASDAATEVIPPAPAFSTVLSVPEPLLDVLPDLSCLDLPADLSERMGDPMILQEIENFTCDDDIMILEGEPEIANAAAVPESVSTPPVQQISPTSPVQQVSTTSPVQQASTTPPVQQVSTMDCGIALVPRRAPTVALSEQLLAPFRDFVWKMWETFLEERLLPEPSSEDSTVATDAQFIFAKLKEAGFDSSRMEQLVADYLGTVHDLMGIRETVFGQLSAEEHHAEESKANDAVQERLRRREAAASRLEEILSRLDVSRRECNRLREQLKQLEATILSSESEASAAKEDLEVQSKELSLVENELARVRALPVIDQAKESHMASLENTFFSLQKELKDLKNL